MTSRMNIHLFLKLLIAAAFWVLVSANASAALVRVEIAHLPSTTWSTQGHVFDLGTDVYHRQACPTALVANIETLRGVFSEDGHELHWHLPEQVEPVSLVNPLVRPTPE